MNAQRVLTGLVAFAIILVLVIACAPAPTAPSAPVTTAPTSALVTPATAAFPLTITDDAGRPVTIKAAPQRIISLAPSNTEVVYALGQGALVVGVTDYCDYPPEAKEKPKVGGYAKIDLEKRETSVFSFRIGFEGHPTSSIAMT